MIGNLKKAEIFFKFFKILSQKLSYILGQRDEVLEHLYANEFTNIDIENVMLSWFE